MVNVDFPTPPLPLRINILCLMPDRREVMRAMSGSGPFGVEAQMIWLGQPAQASPWPASVDSGPGQCSGSGAIREGWFLSGAERSTWMGSSSVVEVMEDMIHRGRERRVVDEVCLVLCAGAWAVFEYLF